MNDYKNTLTVIVPELLIDDANNLAAVLGASLSDLETFTLRYTDEEGAKYAAASGLIKDTVLSDASSELKRPDFDTENIIDMVKAKNAQLYIKWDLSDVKGSITCSISEGLSSFIQTTGLTVIPTATEI